MLARFPKPVPGLVIRYSYLWASEHDTGREEGQKDRPCAIVMTVGDADDETFVIVLPITHRPPAIDDPAIEIPIETKRRLDLDDERSWVVLSEANHFAWPGFDLRPAKHDDVSSVAYGELPANFFRDLRAAFVRAIHGRRMWMIPRSE